MALFLSLAVAAASAYTIDDTPCAASPASCRALDGVGGLSGGGATSVFLPYYPPQQREEILDFLFKPNFGAALQILKVCVVDLLFFCLYAQGTISRGFKRVVPFEGAVAIAGT